MLFFSYGVIIESVANQFGVAMISASLGAVVQWITFGIASYWIGIVAEKIGAVSSIKLGMFVIFIGFFLLAFNFNFPIFIVAFGIFVGAGVSATYGPVHNLIMSDVSTSRRNLALGIVMTGQGLGPFLLIPLITTIVVTHGLKFTFSCFFVSSFIIFFVSLFLNDKASIPKDTKNQIKLYREQIIENTIVTLSHFFGCASHSIILIYLFSYMLTIFHKDSLIASSMLSTIGISGLFSRALIPSIATLIKGKNALLLALIFQAVGATLLLAHTEIKPFYYMASIIFGLGLGGEMVVFPIITTNLFKENFSRRYGMQLLGMGFGMGSGILLGGYLFNVYHSYIPLIFISILMSFLAFLTISFIKETTNMQRQYAT